MEGISFDEDCLPVEEDDQIKHFIENTPNGSFVTKYVIPDLSLWDAYFGRGRLTVATGKRKETESGTPHEFHEVSGETNSDSFLKSNRVNFEVDENEDSLKSHKRVSFGSCSVGKLNIRGGDKGEGGVSTLKEFVKPNVDYEHSDKLYTAVTSLEEVKERGNSFAARAIKYLVKEKLDTFFVRADSAEMKWEWIKDVE